ncbi:DUF4382 domain-containing protein [Ferruginibacter sp. SUN002]|uniref:DUF4382 domain-containing protein n=1 Tax=Ferruginibacter sp. SUN002 TaxID=2937789 RepID=UPI003D3614C7
MKKFKVIMSVFVLGLLISSCSKSNDGTYSYNVKMTDAPGPYSAVYVDIRAIELTGSNGNVVTMNTKAGIYNLLDFSNGIDTLIATGTLNVATVQQIRLILGTNNSVVLNNVTYPLSTPSADQSGLKLQVNHTIQAGVAYTVLLDFDANKSIVETGAGVYKLKPVIRTIVAATSGSIKGKISPVGTLAMVTATSATTSMTYSSNVNVDGEFIIAGLPADTYSITVTPALPLLPVTQGNIAVTTGATANTGTMLF